MAETTAAIQLPIDGDGVCMRCKEKPTAVSKLTCKTCVTPWHVDCLSKPPASMSDVAEWECPDCDTTTAVSAVAAAPGAHGGGVMEKIRAIEADTSLSDVEKAKKRQVLLYGSSSNGGGDDVEEGVEKDDNEILAILGENIQCSFCLQLPQRPVTTPCGHNFCLKCFEKWVQRENKRTCAKCRNPIPALMISAPKINSSLVYAIRAVRTQKPVAAVGPRVFQYVRNEDLPDEAFTTERAVKSGKANAKSGRIFVTTPPDHLGPITAEYDPERKTGVLVGDSWADRMACRQWGAHLPHVSGIAGQAKYGAQSVVLSGGYEDDQDHGEWFLYTGSGGRDLSGNKRTNKEHSHDQKFTLYNESLRLSCLKGYPVRVIRSYKEKRSSYAPDKGVRYDGVYRIEKCWLHKGAQKFMVCRYLFVRCDNSPAPWSSDEHGDRPRELPVIPELKNAAQLTERKESPHWDFDEVEGCWKWMKPQPSSKLSREKGTGGSRTKKSSKAKIMKEFSCLICRKVLNLPITTPCAHNFCKACLDGAFDGQKFTRERKTGGRQLRTQKTVMKCPSCTNDLSDFLQNAQVNRELMQAIESIQRKFEEEKEADTGVEEDEAADEDEEEEEEEEEVDAEDKENVVQASEENQDKSEKQAIEKLEGAEAGCENTEGGDKAEPPAAKKRGRKRKDAAAGATVKVGGRKSQRLAADDGNDSPSSPLHVRSDNELE